ncbi:DUF6128 domain-containing protein [[Clostridium] symbiosum]|uniref:DUF6128 domain-containing protein n=1 Tax=Clostridium symbiosum TaxID=1512 RepID=UPI001D0879B4|nr:DUF6128 domain-containing protein [[Clostridium] symbiosum]MCB6609632.1 DUF6128 domain-containing protein [[Clostridium] symbiosum]MCB6933126.1 DUF6128 domain-containing protein [[Clostridium] symbiosum]
MSNYQRLISYIYTYEGGIRGKNIGFAKLETRGNQCRITVNVKKIFVGGNPVGVYLLAGQDEVKIGTLFARNGAGEFRAVVNSADVENSGHSLEEFYGLSVHDVESAWRSYTTIWEDAVAHAAEVELADVTSEKVAEKLESSVKKQTILQHKEKEQDLLPISREIEAEMDRETSKKEAEIHEAAMRKAEEYNAARYGREKVVYLSTEIPKKNADGAPPEENRAAVSGLREMIMSQAPQRDTESMAENPEKETADMRVADERVTETAGIEAGEVETAEAEAGEVETAEAEAGEVETARTEAGEVETVRTEAGEVETVRTEAGALETAEAEAGEVETAGTEVGEVETAGAEAGVAETVRAEAGEVETARAEAGEVETAGADAEVTETSATEARAAETEMAENEAIETETAGVWQTKAGPVETGAGEIRFANTRAAKVFGTEAAAPVSGGSMTDMMEAEYVSAVDGLETAQEFIEPQRPVMREPDGKPAQTQENGRNFVRSPGIQMQGTGRTAVRSSGMAIQESGRQMQPGQERGGRGQQRYGVQRRGMQTGALRQETLRPESLRPESPRPEAPRPETPRPEALRTETPEPATETNPIAQEAQPVVKEAAPPSGVSAPFKDLSDTCNEQEVWETMRKKYPKILAFDYADGCEVLTIKPQDIGLLPREEWVYGSNSFLLHGYYNYRYLILARLNNPGGKARYLLGVPGHYLSNEKYMASMFGFSDFVLAKKQPPRDGRFGYWYTDIKIGD